MRCMYVHLLYRSKNRPTVTHFTIRKFCRYERPPSRNCTDRFREPPDDSWLFNAYRYMYMYYDSTGD